MSENHNIINEEDKRKSKVNCCCESGGSIFPMDLNDERIGNGVSVKTQSSLQKAENIDEESEVGGEFNKREKDDHNHVHEFEGLSRNEVFRLIFGVILLIVAVGLDDLIHNKFPHYIEYLFYVPAYIFVSWRVISEVFEDFSIKELLDENFLMLVATIGAFLIDEIPEAIGVMAFFNLGEALEQISIYRSKRSIKNLLDIRPDHANIIKNNQILEVLPSEIKVGDKILIKAGERVPIDGKIIQGQSSFDTSPLTGESIPKSFYEGDEIYSGIINISNTVIVEATREYKNSSIMKILKLVEEAEERKSKTDRFIKKFAKIYTPTVVGIAIIIVIIPLIVIPGAVFKDWFYRALIFLVISCPCALVISIPLGYFVSIGIASKNGILIKGSNYIDVMAKLDAILYDKTGTITRGNFFVKQVVPVNGFSEEDIIYYTSHVESQSTHPIASCILNACEDEPDQLIISYCENIPSYGIFAIVDNKKIYAGNDKILHKFNIPHSHEYCEIKGTVVHVAIDGKYAGYILISDEIKPEARETVKALKELGIKYQAIVSGDEESVVRVIAKELEIDEYFAKLLPEDKVRILNETKQKYKYVGFIGDGINDAPVIANASVGFAMGALGSDAAIESSDIVITSDNLSKIPIAISLSRKTLQIVVQNIIIVFFVKILFLVLGALGISSMWGALIADVGVALLAILNAIRGLYKPYRNILKERESHKKVAFSL
ncbi:MAG: heavy metal translocating P-type ATPase [Promethearchaeota archaeon]